MTQSTTANHRHINYQTSIKQGDLARPLIQISDIGPQWETFGKPWYRVSRTLSNRLNRTGRHCFKEIQLRIPTKNKILAALRSLQVFLNCCRRNGINRLGRWHCYLVNNLKSWFHSCLHITYLQIIVIVNQGNFYSRMNQMK